MNNQTIIDALNFRYAVKEFDKNKKVSETDLKTILESGRLSPSTFGLEPWNFIVVNNKETREKIRVAGYDQPKITDASHLIVVTARTDKDALTPELIKRTSVAQKKTEDELKGLSDMVSGSIAMMGDNAQLQLAAQTYIPLGIMIETAALLGVDGGPMGGFDPNQVDEILGLKEKNLHAVSMLALGYRGDDAYAKLPKVRKAFDEVVTFVD